MPSLFPQPSRRCGGTPARAGYAIDVEGSEQSWCKPDRTIDGCGRELVAIDIPPSATVPQDGDRPLFAKVTPALICPYCDAACR